ncbi:uncharacterized protein LOC124407651 isoform X1 [Diprion similis]|uniref:uncharacterized protein LOC124407651 isoform X1 n=1 Tax=Diprion similis TaxID=362088 RepID=UPI001EF94F42|nr:uncharacterized protein LOC124407651 isoform X1 [Diprion similis]XP_046739940.1 uncharacterized protein LOC124407651 isoform X1 [Diprion similis]XP_046739941.1 uncharacterized protein LOC124407651 isoform X1 [Diprion similis]XP_046739942.1 uncharacterized protein LOC124407651 isoform X1 [Diprion similis]XP_046739943.1 uncharacterized protein LOC124407651 isoform X1 [Diprion similis]XP_046739945.1 uncharacterized protein LOC124407651 isoform X1 [Diprion similis]
MPVPAYIIQHTYLRAEAAMPRRRPVPMMNSRLEDDMREADCSGRALATLVVAWVGAALVASVLLKWTHMWVALAVLTLLFLAACGYAACDARRTHERALAREEQRQLERRRRREQQLESVAGGGIDNYPEIINPPEYQTYWVSDLPPSYNMAVNTTGSVGGATSGPEVDTEAPITAPRLSNPPPYAVAIQSEPLLLPIQNALQSGLCGGEIQPAVHGGSQNTGPQAAQEGGQTSSHSGNSGLPNNQSMNTAPRFLTPPPPLVRDEDKVGEGPDSGQNTGSVAQTRTQYLASIINSTFGRSRRINNGDQNVSLGNGQTESQNNRNNINNTNNVTGQPPQYPARLSD